ncbi:hypothetical protein Tco_0129170 [Tanacetum coccineum]
MEMNRLADLKAEKEKSEKLLKKILNPATIRAQTQKMAKHEAKRQKMFDEYNHQISFRADQLPITKINYVVNPNKEATMNITRGDNPLNLIVHPNFRLKTLGFCEWLEAKKLGLPPPPVLATFGITAEERKEKVFRFYKRQGLVIREPESVIFFYNGNLDLVFQREEEFYLATIAQLIRPLRSIQRDTLKAKKMFTKLELTIEARDDAAQARDIVMKGLSECKASESNIRHIQVKDIVKEVEDYLKTYSSVEMDISW